MAILPIVGAVLLVIGGIWLLLLAFQTSLIWGLATLLIPFAGLVFALTHWDEAKGAFFTALAGAAVMLFFGTPWH